ncbi:hypothetical protein CDL12_02835 [Handroanthus impetiginosus]|uniref:Uncharacterized protein n=1 Tax=Handroanthus impetiginosus TaxID=429701 RepID=A0A2G9I3V0_9LAMI|nr:hypothetical protein CDL12_02835 [Handroanthus impetiginosus]
MSTDLEFRLPPQLKISTSETSDTTDYEISSSNEEDNCHTPKSPQNMIPAAVSCPPAPKKRRRAAACKRKLCEFQFFEIVAREEVESLFRTIEVNFNRSTKRKCVV